MAGFFDKLNKAIGDITKKVEESGIVEDLKDMVSGEGSETADAAAGDGERGAGSGGDEGPGGWDGAVQRAGFDPMELMSPAQMGDVVGLELDHSYQQFEDEWFGVTWTTQANGGPYVEARFAHGYTDGSPVDVPGMWQFVTTETGDNEPVDVADAEAVIDDLNTVYVNTGGSVFYIVSGGLPHGASARQLHVAVANAVAARLI